MELTWKCWFEKTVHTTENKDIPNCTTDLLCCSWLLQRAQQLLGVLQTTHATEKLWTLSRHETKILIVTFLCCQEGR